MNSDNDVSQKTGSTHSMNDETKARAFEFYWEGYQLGHGTESLSELDKQTAYSKFEQYLNRNYE